MAADTDVAIVGAGAAGLATGIFVRRLDPSVRVTVLDGAKLPGAKIVISGGGRCNVTNAVVTDADFWGGRRAVIRRVLRALPVDETVRFFNELGVPLKEEPGGKLFPVSNRSRDVSEALIAELRRRGATLETARRVTSIARDGDGFRIESPAGALTTSRVVLATGGRSLPKTGSDGAGYALAEALGHTIVPTTPALAPLVLADGAHQTLSGVSMDVALAIWIDGAIAERLAGSMLWTHFGVSGPVVLNASRHWERATLEGRRVAVTADLLGGAGFEEAERRLLDFGGARAKTTVQSAVTSLLPASVAAVVTAALGLPATAPLAQLTREDRRKLSHALTAWPLAVTRSRGYDFAEATAGGVPLDEVHASTLESKVCPRLYLTGEILDVDGRIGGFNFQWAWASARVAADAIARDRQP